MQHLRRIMVGLLAAAWLTPIAMAQSTDVTPVYLEDSPDAEDLLKQAQHLRGQKRLTEAAAMYQKIADDYGRKLMRVDGSLHVDGRRWVRQAVSGDADLLAAYRRLYEPTAARLVDEATQGGARLASLEEVASRFALCESGLEAALRCASLMLESGRPAEAGRILDEFATHGDLPARQTRWRLLQAAAGLYSGDAERLRTHQAALSDQKATDALKQLDEWAANLQRQAAAPSLSALQPLPKVELPDPLGKPLYTRDLDNPQDDARDRTAVARRTRVDNDHHIMPTLLGDTLYVNTGYSLRAIDRSSLSDIWSLSLSTPVPDGSQVDRFGGFRGERLSRDQRGVHVSGSTVVAVVGRGTLMTRNHIFGSAPETMTVGVNRTDGKVLWRKTPSDLDQAWGAAFFHGTPVGADGRSFVLVRRVQQTGFRDAFIVALDDRTGAMLWRRHLSSCSVRFNVRSYAQPLLAEGRLYVADNLGAVACLDARSGEVRWLQKMSELKLTGQGGGTTEWAWQVGPPVLLPAGLLVSPFASGTAAVLLDATTGKRLRDIDDAAICQASCLIAAAGDLIAIGESVQRFDGKTFESKWKYNLAPAGVLAARGAVTADRVLVPTDDKLIVLELADGIKVSESPLKISGNLLPAEGEVLVTSGSLLRGYMTWPVVYNNIRARIRKSPNDAQPGLALAHAAIASNKPAEALEGVDHVVAVLRLRSLNRLPEEKPEADQVHADVFQQLLRLVEPGATEDVKLRGDIFDRIAKTAQTPRDEVQYHLAYGGYLAEVEWPADIVLDRRREAVRHYQTVLESPLLSSQLLPRGSGQQAGGLEARMRVAGMIERFGRGVYEEFDERAAAQFERLAAAEDADPAALMELARRYPMSRSTAAALLAAGEALARGGNHMEAVTQLRRAHREKPSPQLLPRIVSRLVEEYIATGKPRRARQWLQRAERENLALMRGGKSVTAAQWLADLGDAPTAAGALPELRTQLGDAAVLTGKLLTPLSQPRDAWPLDRIVLVTENTIQLRGGPALDRVWEVRDEQAQATELLWLNETAVVMWQEARGVLLALDARTGKPLWPALSAPALFKDVAGVGRPLEDPVPEIFAPPADPRIRIIRPDFRRDRSWPLTINGQSVGAEHPFARRPIRIAANDSVICLIDSAGRVLCIDIDTGQLAWRYSSPFEEVTHVAINSEVIALAGLSRPLGVEQATVLTAALDALTGDVLCQVESPAALAWLGLGDGNTLTCVSLASPDDRIKPAVSVHQLPDGGKLWQADLAAFRIDTAAQLGDRIFIVGDTGNLLVVDTAARKVAAWSGASLDRMPWADVSGAGDLMQLLTPAVVAAQQADGAMAWRDAIDEDAGFRVMQLLARSKVVMVTLPVAEERNALLVPRLQFQRLPDPQLLEENMINYRLFVADRAGGALLREYRLPVQGVRLDPRQALILNHRIVIGAGWRTIVVPDAGN